MAATSPSPGSCAAGGLSFWRQMRPTDANVPAAEIQLEAAVAQRAAQERPAPGEPSFQQNCYNTPSQTSQATEPDTAYPASRDVVDLLNLQDNIVCTAAEVQARRARWEKVAGNREQRAWSLMEASNLVPAALAMEFQPRSGPGWKHVRGFTHTVREEISIDYISGLWVGTGPPPAWFREKLTLFAPFLVGMTCVNLELVQGAFMYTNNHDRSIFFESRFCRVALIADLKYPDATPYDFALITEDGGQTFRNARRQRFIECTTQANLDYWQAGSLGDIASGIGQPLVSGGLWLLFTFLDWSPGYAIPATIFATLAVDSFAFRTTWAGPWIAFNVLLRSALAGRNYGASWYVENVPIVETRQAMAVCQLLLLLLLGYAGSKYRLGMAMAVLGVVLNFWSTATLSRLVPTFDWQDVCPADNYILTSKHRESGHMNQSIHRVTGRILQPSRPLGAAIRALSPWHVTQEYNANAGTSIPWSSRWRRWVRVLIALVYSVMGMLEFFFLAVKVTCCSEQRYTRLSTSQGAEVTQLPEMAAERTSAGWRVFPLVTGSVSNIRERSVEENSAPAVEEPFIRLGPVLACPAMPFARLLANDEEGGGESVVALETSLQTEVPDNSA